jgi:hypothetical protein
MMKNIMFLLPEKSGTPQCIQRHPKYIIYPMLAAVAAMTGIMHYTKANTGKVPLRQQPARM